MGHKNRKALSPVVASIILIAVIIAVCIAVAVWGALTFGIMKKTAPFDKINFTNDLSSSEIAGRLHLRNISIVMAPQINADATFPIQTFDNFLSACELNNVTSVLTDYRLVEIPPIYHANTTYIVEQYSFWFYDDVAHVGKVAVVCQLDFEAWWEGD